MSLSTHTLKRLRTIKKGLLDGLTREQLGDMCGVTEKTIDRDMMTWFKSGLFEIWIKEEWLRHHLIVSKKDPVEAYKQLTKLLGHTFVRKVEQQIDVKEIKLLWIKDERDNPDKLQTTPGTNRVPQ